MKGKTHDLDHDLTFSAHTINCVCHSIWSMFRVLGIYNFDSRVKKFGNKITFLCCSILQFLLISSLCISEREKKKAQPYYYYSDTYLEQMNCQQKYTNFRVYSLETKCPNCQIILPHNMCKPHYGNHNFFPHWQMTFTVF